MKITIIGTGYVGLVSGACFAELGVDVTCVDIDKDKIDSLRRGIITIYEPNLEALVARNAEAERLKFTTDLAAALEKTEVVFLAVGTPPNEDGSADLQHVIEVARNIGDNMQHHLVVVNKSTVPVGTAKKVRQTIQERLDRRGSTLTFDVASNPEFLKEGNAIDDFMKPDRVVVGVDSPRAEKVMTRLYRPMLLNNFRVIFMDIPSAEMTKYAANSMLATRISFMNEIANLCEKVGADINMVRKGIASDSRIGGKFLYAGCGYGGSCFPKDVKALINTAKQNGCSMEVLNGVEAANYRQKDILFNKFSNHFNGEIKGKRVAIWGLAFKPGTDDMRQAPSLTLIERLLEGGCRVVAYDPAAMSECRRIIGERIEYASNIYDTAIDAEAIFHVTEWKEFRMPSWEALRRSMMPHPILLDGRNVFDGCEIEEHGFKYYCIGR